MWILPKQLHTSHFVPDTEALISDLDEQSQICEPSLLARSKPSLARTWSQRWKRDSWTQHLSGRILKLSHGQSFVTAWTSSLEVIPASHSQQQASDSEQKIHDTSGHLSQPELFPCDPESVSLRTSKDTSASDSDRSLANWKDLVTRLRGEYSLRVKSAHLTNASECSSWPSPIASEVRQGFQDRSRGMKGTQESLTTVVIKHGQAVPVSPSTDGSRLESSQEGRLWMTPKSGQCGMTATTSGRPLEKATQLTTQVYVVNRQESWGTPTARDHKSGRGKEDRDYKELTPMVERAQSGKLNPRWVETLMGLPIGWTMPSCSSPLTIAPMNSDCLATESSQPLQPELF
jgi:hypothetical protein